MAKRLMCIIISVLMIVSLLPTAAFATDESGDSNPVVESTADADEGDAEESGETEEVVEAEAEEAAEATEETTVSAAAQAVQSMIDALPTVDEVAAMDTDGQNEVYTAFLEACEAYDALSEEDQATVDDSALDTLSDYFNGMVSTTATIPTSGALTTGTYTLTGNVTLTGALTVASGQTVVIDLAGYTISYSGSSVTLLISNTGTLTIMDSSEAGAGKISFTYTGSSSAYVIRTSNGGTLTVESGGIEISSTNGTVATINATSSSSSTQTITINDGTISSTSSAGNAYGIYGQASKDKITVNDGTITATSTSGNAYGVYSSASNVLVYTAIYGGSITATGGVDSYGVYVSDNSAKVYGGSISANGAGSVYGVYAKYTTVSDGTITASGDGTTYGVYGSSSVTITDGTISSSTTDSNSTAYVANKATISDGNFTGTLYEGTTVTGGTFSYDVSDFVNTDTYQVKSNGDGTYTVSVKNSEENGATEQSENHVASVTSKSDSSDIKYYISLQDAIDAASENDTVSLLVDVSENVTVAESQSITLDLCGFTLTTEDSTANVSIIYVYGTMTLKDSSEDQTGKITGSGAEIPSTTNKLYGGGIRVKGTVTMESGSITGNGKLGNYVSGAGVYVDDGGTFTMNGGSISDNLGDWGGGVYVTSGGTFTMNDGEISGNTIQNWGGGVVLYGNCTFTMNGGTITGNKGVYGGGIYLHGSSDVGYPTFVMTKGAIYNNTATTEGADIYSTGSSSVTLIAASEMTDGTKDFTGYCWYTDASGNRYDAETNVTDTVDVSETLTGAYSLIASKPYTFTLGISTDSTTTVPAEIASGEGTATMYVKVTSENIGSYTNAAYPTTSLTFGDNNTGYVFAGWYEDSEGTTTCTSVPSTDAYAKFVDENVLDVWVQTTSGTSSASEKTDMRLVSTVDTLRYACVGFEITITQSTKTSTTSVYKQLVGSSGETVFNYSPEDICSISTYFMTYTIFNIPNSSFDTQMTIRAYWTTNDGTTVYGTARVVSVNDVM
ncbi:MAG: right-handed parallel beta-helix repeat-containing protein [Oscillospiraceae bacterium]|nr:right-handed parallel beta-helix repeat-containing protein [Oscillospiraceae bacterium]